jgi:mannose-1-phosphate guanylyltransferase
MLSAIGIIASFYNSLGYQNLCEKVYVKYVSFVEEFYEQNSVETSNAYFMVGVYYFE